MYQSLRNIATGCSLLVIFYFISANVFGQKKSPPLFGLGAGYNFQTEGSAIDLRANLPLLKNICISPRFSYFPASNQIHEFYIGSDIDIYLPLKKKFAPYILAGAYYDNWINSSDYHNDRAQRNNFVFECGGGLMMAFKCFYPFIEGRYDTKWKEGTLGLGILFQFGECFGGNSAKKCSRF